MKKDTLAKKINKERRRVKWTSSSSALKTFLLTIVFITILTLIIFGFTTAVVAIFNAIG